MKLHFDSDHPENAAYTALRAAKDAGKIDPDVFFDKCDRSGSRSRRFGLDVHLVTYVGGKGTTHPRRPNNGTSGYNGYDDVYAATYDEWGWFLAELYRTHPELTCATYRTREDFDRATKGAFELVPA
jgi:hypothetical protein